ncbi:MAG TPA: endonuclease Q family protein, partial [Allocoleopsis sp.]
MTLPVMMQYAQQKGLDILSASDFTHPVWFNEISQQLEEAGEGVYRLKGESAASNSKETLFLLSTEIASIYKQDGKLRRVHNLIFLPSLEVVAKLNQELIRRGCNLASDGRPIVGISSRNLLDVLLTVDERSMLIPCHIWTPHFGVYGSASGFNSLEEAYGDLAPYVYGIETGISSDPGMNWEVPELRNRSILSFSDAHSAPKMGREATVFELPEPTYENLRQAVMRTSKESRISSTIEFYPEEGKYHFSGHRNCNVSIGPEEIRSEGNICPVCGRRLIEGVLYRVQQLVDESLVHRVEKKVDDHGVQCYTDKFGEQPPFVKLVPLLEVVAQGIGLTVISKKAQALFAELCAELGS